MTASPVGIIAIAKDLLRTTLANCTAFRTWDGASYTVNQALARIYFDGLPVPGSHAQEYTVAELIALRPYAIIYKPLQGVRAVKAAYGNPGIFNHTGTLEVLLVRSVPDADAEDFAKLDRDFENMIGMLISSGDNAAPGLEELSNTAGYLPMTTIAEDGAYRCNPNDIPGEGDHQVYRLIIGWGVA